MNWTARCRAPFTVTVGAVVFLATLGACSGDDDANSDETTLAAIASATASEESAEIDGTRTLAGALGPLAGRYTADPATGQVTAPVFLPDGTTEPIEVRIINGSVYIERVAVEPAVATADNLTPLDGLGVRVDADPPWLRRPSAALTLAGSVALSGPFTLLDVLAAEGAELNAATSDDDLTRYTIGPEAALVPYDLADARIWVDDELRLRRVQLETSSGVFEYEVDGFGADVGLEPPPPEEVTDADTASGTVPEASGNYEQTASGEQEGVTWSLERASATDDGACWRFASTPALVANDGEVACIADNEVQVAFTTELGASVDVMVVISTTNVNDPEFTFDDGTSQPPVTAQFSNGVGALVWIGAPEPAVSDVSFTTDNGVALTCTRTGECTQ